jgi:hypothetical protein
MYLCRFRYKCKEIGYNFPYLQSISVNSVAALKPAINSRFILKQHQKTGKNLSRSAFACESPFPAAPSLANGPLPVAPSLANGPVAVQAMASLLAAMHGVTDIEIVLPNRQRPTV